MSFPRSMENDNYLSPFRGMVLIENKFSQGPWLMGAVTPAPVKQCLYLGGTEMNALEIMIDPTAKFHSPPRNHTPLSRHRSLVQAGPAPVSRPWASDVAVTSWERNLCPLLKKKLF